MRRAFESGTIAEEMWGLLRSNCQRLLPKEEKAKPHRLTSLGRRLKSESEPVEVVEEIKEVAPPSPPVARVPAREPIRAPAPVRPEEVEEKREEAVPSRYCLALQDGQHRIALPVRGEVVLGRFDPATDVTPDVDLTHDDRKSRVISRRHARIVGHDGWHEIEDLGSTNGTRVNGRRLNIAEKVQLRLGDRVTLGSSVFVYIPIPEIQVSPHAAPPQAYLWSAFTGHRFPLPSRGEVIVGRSDSAVGFVPEIDLGREGVAAQVVARRHVRVVARYGRHYVEDLGSASSTKLNGVRVEIGEIGPLNSGDHLWLGGCVLAYDIELQPDNTPKRG